MTNTATSTSADALTGLEPKALAEFGLHVVEGRRIAGVLTYERPAFVFDPRRILDCRLGAFSYINGHLTSSLYDCDVGRYCSIAESAVIGPPEHPTNWLSSHLFVSTHPSQYPQFYVDADFAKLAPDASETPRFPQKQRTVIGHDVWVGAGAFIKRGLVIGHGAVIAAGAVVTHDVAPYSIVAGTPAKVIKMRFADDIIATLLKLEWWRYDMAPHKQDIDFTNIESSIEALLQLKAEHRLMPLTPLCYEARRQPDGRFDLRTLDHPLFFPERTP